jgi:UDP-N-acetylglucosamine--N-acetylmuramyl-(pentapeptide) pyrophosphoryl-undecaprenol N-acetylglucosamine transferase
MNKLRPIIFTGGHHNSALVVAKLLQESGHKILWLGHKTSISQAQDYVSEEIKDVQKAGITFIELKTGKIHRGNIFQWFKFIRAVFFCIYLFIQNKPAIVVSFGGYLAVPAVLAAWLLRIPAVSHEQTATLGLANKIMLPLLKTLFSTWKIQSLNNHPKIKVVGLPVPKVIPAKLNRDELAEYFSDPTKPLLVITGGKQGSHAINLAAAEVIKELLGKYNVYHQAGNNTQYDDLKHLTQIRKLLPRPLRESYYIVGYSHDFPRFLRTASIIVGRSGAHTVYDVIRFKQKMLSIPLPFSYADEQYLNAHKVVDHGLGLSLEQSELTPSALLKKIDKLAQLKPDTGDLNHYIHNNLPDDAASVMTKDILEIVNSSK